MMIDWRKNWSISSEATGENLWRMPLYPDYKEMLKSDIADLLNSAGKSAIIDYSCSISPGIYRLASLGAYRSGGQLLSVQTKIL